MPRSRPLASVSSALFLGVLFVASHASATVIVQPVAIVSNELGDQPGFEEELLFGQEGLSSPYVSGVTDFDAFTQNEAHSTSSGIWNSAAFAGTGRIVFDLGSILDVRAFAIWQHSSFYGQDVRDLTLRIDEDGDFSSGSTLALSASQIANNEPFATTFQFSPVSGRFVEFHILSNNGNGFGTRINEVAFGVVPEPSTGLLLAIGLVVLRARRRSLGVGPKEVIHTLCGAEA